MAAKDFWLSGKHGSLSPWAQAQVFALHTLNTKMALGLEDNFIARQVSKVGGGQPAKQCIAQLRAAFEDPAWHPGKGRGTGEQRGPKPRFSKTKKRAVASAAMALKKSGVEPTVAAAIDRCP